MDEAEKILDDAVARARATVVRFLARAREETEDIWAEAKSLSERKR
jgi:hypothetical protein